jgi:hypothetical protein
VGDSNVQHYLVVFIQDGFHPPLRRGYAMLYEKTKEKLAFRPNGNALPAMNITFEVELTKSVIVTNVV